MMKDCFGQEFVDAQKFRECAQCPIAAQCQQAVYLKQARTVSGVGQGLGYVVGMIFLALGILNWARMPNGAPWLVFVSLVYLIAVGRAGKEYRLANAEDQGLQRRLAESGPAPAPAAHGHH
jgi:hypothetical protein